MTILPPLPIQQIMSKYHLTPSKGLGQNFLTDEFYLSEITRIAEIPESGVVLEIGPGLGSLTRHLAAAAEEVIAVELDRRMILPLQEVLTEAKNVRIIQGDILETDPDRLLEGRQYQVVANIPYYITSAVIRHLLNAKAKPSSMVLTVQKEVAQRICASPGDLSLLALSVQIYGKPSLPLSIPADAFTPQPKVDSAVVRIDLYPAPRISAERQDDFFQFAKAGFGQKRKTLRNSLSSNLKQPAGLVEEMLRESGIDPMRRAETLSIDEWDQLIRTWQGSKNS